MGVPAAEDDDSSSFCPSNVKLVDCYLRAKLDGVIGDVANAAFFLDADVCSARPQDLVRAHHKPARVSTRDASDGQQFYFFSPVRFLGSSQKKKARTIVGTNGKESWHAEGSPKPVEGSVAGGFIQRFSYHVRIGPKSKNVEKPRWIMLEYSFEGGKMVLCKVYKSPRGPGVSMMRSGCKRKATDDLEAATPATRPRQTNQAVDDAILFAGNIERDHPAAAPPELTELQTVEEILLEPQIMPASFDGNTTLGEIEMFLMTEDDGNGTTLQVPEDDAILLAWEYQAAAREFTEMQNAVESLSDTLAAAADLEARTPSTRPRQTYQEEADDILFDFDTWDIERDLLLPVEHEYNATTPEYIETKNVDGIQPETQIVPASFDGDTTLGDVQKMMMVDEDDNGTMLHDGVNPDGYYMGLLIGNDEQHDAAVQTLHGPLLTDYDLMAALAAGLDDLVSPSCPHLGGSASCT